MKKAERGFVTVATGNIKYYKVAANLLKSYRYYSKNPLPFCILTDRYNEYTNLFDDVIIINNPTHSYLDKIYLLNNIPYHETIFVEADCLAYGDLNSYFDAFVNATDFCVFGTNYPLNHDFRNGGWGWFQPDKMGKYKGYLHFIPRFGSGIIYLRQGKTCQDMYNICLDVWKNSYKYGFLPLDDQILAVACSVMNCPCIDDGPKYQCCVYPFYKEQKWKPKPQMHKRQCSYSIPNLWTVNDALLCHFSNYLTEKAIYKREIFSLKKLIDEKTASLHLGILLYNMFLPFSDLGIRLEAFNNRLFNKIKRKILLLYKKTNKSHSK